MDDCPPADFAPVEVRLIGYERMDRTGSLVALLTAEVVIADIVLRIQGMQIRKASNGNVELKAPQFKSRDGRWRDG